MTAIWPAGPPKVCSEMPNQVRTAARNGTVACWSGGAGSCWGAVSRVMGSSAVEGGSGRLAAEHEAAAVVLVEPVEDGAGDGEGVLVVPGHRQSAQDDVQSGGLGSVEALVVEVGLVHDLGDPPQHRVGELVPAQDGLEGAVAVVVAEVDPAHVERCRVGRHLAELGDEHELGVRVEGPADEPGAGGAVDVHPGPGRPPHWRTCAAAAAGAVSPAAASPSSRSADRKSVV